MRKLRVRHPLLPGARVAVAGQRPRGVPGTHWRDVLRGAGTLGLAMLVAGGCGGPAATAAVTPSPQVTRSPATPSPATSDAAAVNLLQVGCSDNAPCDLSAGTWRLDGRHSFILGMELTVPDGWQSLEQDAGEFNLFPLDHPADHLFMVKDVAAVTTDGSFKIVQDVPQTVDGLTDYWRNDPNLVVSPSQPATIGDGIDAVTYVITVSPDAAFADPGCPVYPRCADFFTDPKYWDGPYGVGAPAAVRLYLATIRSGDTPHLFIIGLEGEDEAALARLTEDAAPIISSLKIPASFPIW